MQHITLGMAPARATRISFAGELGWELGVPLEYAGHVYETLVETGAGHGLAQAGMLVLDSCRIEKGFRHWGHDLGPDSTPLEAGLAFTVAWNKPGGFLGHEALLRQREKGVRMPNPCCSMMNPFTATEFSLGTPHRVAADFEPDFRSAWVM